MRSLTDGEFPLPDTSYEGKILLKTHFMLFMREQVYAANFFTMVVLNNVKN